jgi:hypothetical protein
MEGKERVMRHSARLLVAAVMLAGTTVYAQEGGAGAGHIEIGAFPGGGVFFTESNDGTEPAFGNYALGASFTLNVNRWIGIEGEGGRTVGVRQDFTVGPRAYDNELTPDMWAYSGNLLVTPLGNNRMLVPYGTGGVGGLTLSPNDHGKRVGVSSYQTYLTGNVGGGMKWFATRHFGVRGDYRLFVLDGKDTPAFFGADNRYGHRVQAGLVFTY